MKKIILPILFLLCFLTPRLHAQEFNFSVTVNTKQVSGTDQRVYDALQEAVTNFMNNRVWTSIKFEEQKKEESRKKHEEDQSKLAMAMFQAMTAKFNKNIEKRLEKQAKEGSGQ